jgi:predicted dehydrogenase
MHMHSTTSSNGLVRLGIIGAGAIGRIHASMFEQIEGVDVAGLFDINTSLATELAEEHHISKVYESADALLNSNDLDAIVIGVPNKFHKPFALQALQADKHVLLEKPMGLNGADAREIYNAQQHSGKTFMIAHQMRWQWINQEIQRYARKGAFGKIYAAKTGWFRRSGIPGWGSWFTRKTESGGGPLADIGVHMLDVTRYLMGNPKPVSVFGSVYSEFGPRQKGLGGWGTPDWDGLFDVEDLALALIRMEDGSTLSLEVSWAVHTDKSDDIFIRLMGTEGGAVIINNTSATLCGEMFEQPSNIEITAPEHAENSRISLSRHFIDCIRKQETPLIDAFSGLVNNMIIDAIYESAHTGKSIELQWD